MPNHFRKTRLFMLWPGLPGSLFFSCFFRADFRGQKSTQLLRSCLKANRFPRTTGCGGKQCKRRQCIYDVLNHRCCEINCGDLEREKWLKERTIRRIADNVRRESYAHRGDLVTLAKIEKKKKSVSSLSSVRTFLG